MRKTVSPLTVRCLFCGWCRAGRVGQMLAVQREHRKLHTTTEGRPR